MYIISDANLLRQYQQQFLEQLGQSSTQVIPCYITWRSSRENPGKLKADVNWSSQLDIWWYSRPLENRWWNVFGIGRPSPYSNIGITVEINIPFEGINRNIAGAFADINGKVFLVHRGNRYGGGKRGATKQHFWAHYSGRREVVKDGEQSAQVAVICELGSQNLAYAVAQFVREVDRIKKADLRKLRQGF